MSERFNGRVAVITGGSRGIGKAIAEQLASEKAAVAVLDIHEEALKACEEDFQSKGFDIFVQKADVTSSAEVTKAVENIISHFGQIDILVNNAGVIRDNLIFKMEDADWDLVMNVHLKGSFHMTRAVQSHMVKQKYGRIINISSTSALGNRGQVNYSAAKAGLQGFTKTLAIELGRYGITANSVAPGFIETDMTKATAERIGISFEQLIEASVSAIPVGRSGKPEDIAHAVAFFADEKSSFISGQVLYVAGGPKN